MNAYFATSHACLHKTSMSIQSMRSVMKNLKGGGNAEYVPGAEKKTKHLVTANAWIASIMILITVGMMDHD